MKNYSFKTRLFILFLSSIILPLILITTILTITFTYTLEKENKRQYSNTVNSLSDSISTYLEEMIRLSIIPYQNPELSEYYTFINSSLKENIDKRSTLEPRFEKAMSKIFALTSKTIVGSTFLALDDTTETAYSFSRKDFRLHYEKSMSDLGDKWCKEILSNYKNFTIIPPHTVSSYSGEEIEVFSIAKTFQLQEVKKNIGIVKVDASVDQLSSYFENINLKKNSGILIKDNNGHIIHTTNPELSSYDPLKENPNGKASIGKRIYTVYSSSIGDTSWTVYYLVSNSEERASTYTAIIITLIGSILMILLAYIGFHFSSMTITAPVKNILATMKRVETGDLSIPKMPEYKMNQDFAVITQQLNQMIRQLNEHINREYKLALSQKNAEFSALQAQINPHFLYNTLNGFVTLNRLGDKRLLENSIIQLTNMFKYTCNNFEHCTLEEEFHFIDQYLSLQKMRFDTRLSYSFYLEPSIKNIMLPKLLIQPLVENSIIHGLEETIAPITIEVDASIISTTDVRTNILITVSDNGVGFDSSNLSLDKSIGLTNIRERLNLFNKDSFFAIYSRRNRGTTCHIYLSILDN